MSVERVNRSMMHGKHVTAAILVIALHCLAAISPVANARKPIAKQNVEAMATPRTASQARRSDIEQLWSAIDRMSESVADGAQATINRWPGTDIGQPDKRITYLSSLPGGSFTFGDTAKIKKSEIRISAAGSLILVSLALDTQYCVPRKTVVSRFPNGQISSALGHADTDKLYWNVQSGKSRTSFGFRGKRPDCLSNIVIKPNSR